jgi:hypothetical protein
VTVGNISIIAAQEMGATMPSVLPGCVYHHIVYEGREENGGAREKREQRKGGARECTGKSRAK